MKIINKAKSENRVKFNGIYYEKHHILPKSLFPLWTKRKSNLVLLTAREHFICHLMASKIWSGVMVYALWRLINNKQQKYVIKGGYDYQKIKEAFAKENSKAKTGYFIGFKHSEISKQHMKEARARYVYTEEHKKSMSIAAKKRYENPEERKKLSERSKLRIGEKATHKVPHSEETKKRLSEIMKKRKWYTNGIISKFCDNCPIGWKPGRIMKNMKFLEII
jgi:hypothetical protein